MNSTTHEARRTKAPDPVVLPRILIVDDEALVRWTLENVCKKARCQVTMVESGEKAIAALNSARFDLVITDMKMPDVDGFEVAEAAKRSLPHVPIIMISAWGDEESRRKARGASIYFVDKPFNVLEIKRLIRSLIDG
jgi:CheY-like chemotaxis protein